MNRFEQLKNLSIEEAADLLKEMYGEEFSDSECLDFCDSCDDWEYCQKLPLGIKKWLEEEVNNEN